MAECEFMACPSTPSLGVFTPSFLQPYCTSKVRCPRQELCQFKPQAGCLLITLVFLKSLLPLPVLFSCEWKTISLPFIKSSPFNSSNSLHLLSLLSSPSSSMSWLAPSSMPDPALHVGICTICMENYLGRRLVLLALCLATSTSLVLYK